MDQLDLFEEIAIEACPDSNSRVELDHYNEEYCLKHLRTTDLWDMRAWHKHKDIKEVKAYVDEPSHKNNGHAGWCVKWLKHLGISKAKIVQAIMDNLNISYKNRLVPCMIEARKKLLKAVESFLKTEWIFASDPKDNAAKMKKRVNWFADKITEMKKDL